MSDQLISREALRKAFHERIWYFDKSSWDEANAIIDNAPAVENVTVFCENADEKSIADLKAELQMVIADKRPRGEWIFQKANEEQTDGYECSNCKACFHTKVPYFSEFNFCPNCGADMRKGGAE